MLEKDGARLRIGSGAVYADVRREDGGPMLGNMMRKPKILANGLIIKSARIDMRNITVPAVFFPSTDPQRVFDAKAKVEKEEEIIEAEPVLDEAPKFVQVKRGSVEDIYADLGLIADEDEDVVDTDEDTEDHTSDKSVTNADANKPNFADPEAIFEMLATKDIRNYGITKDDFTALKLTRKQLRELYENVTGRSSKDLDGSGIRKELRKLSSQSFANHKRVMAAIKQVRSKE